MPTQFRTLSAVKRHALAALARALASAPDTPLTDEAMLVLPSLYIPEDDLDDGDSDDGAQGNGTDDDSTGGDDSDSDEGFGVRPPPPPDRRGSDDSALHQTPWEGASWPPVGTLGAATGSLATLREIDRPDAAAVALFVRGAPPHEVEWLYDESADMRFVCTPVEGGDGDNTQARRRVLWLAPAHRAAPALVRDCAAGAGAGAGAGAATTTPACCRSHYYPYHYYHYHY